MTPHIFEIFMIQGLLALKERLVRIEVLACGFLLIVMTLVISYGMFERFVIRHGVGWTDELSRYVSIWAIFFGASLGIVRGAHVGVEVFVRCLPESLQHWAEKISLLICTIFTGVLTWQAVLYFIRLDNSGQVTPAMLIPMSWAFLAVPVGCAFMCVHFLIELVTHGEKQKDTEVMHG